MKKAKAVPVVLVSVLVVALIAAVIYSCMPKVPAHYNAVSDRDYYDYFVRDDVTLEVYSATDKSINFQMTNHMPEGDYFVLSDYNPVYLLVQEDGNWYQCKDTISLTGNSSIDPVGFCGGRGTFEYWTDVVGTKLASGHYMLLIKYATHENNGGNYEWNNTNFATAEFDVA